MSDELFTDAEAGEAWVDVRMTDPEKGEWDVDFVVAGGRVEYVDLRVKPDHLAAFVDCLVDDVGANRANRILSNVVDRQDLDLEIDPPAESDGADDTDETEE
jgi:hypothetical protein